MVFSSLLLAEVKLHSIMNFYLFKFLVYSLNIDDFMKPENESFIFMIMIT